MKYYSANYVMKLRTIKLHFKHIFYLEYIYHKPCNFIINGGKKAWPTIYKCIHQHFLP